MVALIVLTRFTTAKVPDLPVPQSQAMFLGGIVVLAVLALKLISETNALGFGSWLGVLLAAGLAYGGFQMKKEAGPAPTGMGRADSV